MKETSVPNLNRDPRLMMIFLTIIVLGMYAVSVVTTPAVRKPLTLVTFTFLIIIHLILHWTLERLTQNPKWIPWYIIIQGLIALTATLLSGTVGMVYALFMGLIGEGIGLLGLKRGGVMAVLYYLLLSLIGFTYYTGISSAGWWAIGTLPIVIFIATYVTLYMRQIEAREKAQALATELESANRQLSEYAAQVEDLTIANERQRMARELHDTLSQGLAGLILQLEAADAHLTHQRNDKAQSIIGNAMEQARVTLADARRVIDDLRQPSLDDLDSALRIELDRFTNTTGIPVHFHSVQTPPLPDSAKETLVRTLAESLTNITNHAHAQNVAVNVRVKDKSLLFTIQDDGVGFDASAIPSGHYGILGIKERVRLVNGSFEIQSENGKGTMLIIELPISSSALSGTSADRVGGARPSYRDQASEVKAG